MKILVINGPNINMLGIREKNIYGTKTYEDLNNMILDYASSHDIEVEIKQSNYEGDIITYIQDAYFDKTEAIVINPAGYTHTSVAILDALKAVNLPTVEVHISDLASREDFRQISYVSKYVEKRIIGEGLEGYILALEYLLNKYGNKN